MIYYIFLLFHTHLAEQELFVSSAAVDIGDCGSLIQPCATIASAFSHANSSSSVLVHVSDGTYASESPICLSSQNVTVLCSNTVYLRTISFESSTFIFSLISSQFTLSHQHIALTPPNDNVGLLTVTESSSTLDTIFIQHADFTSTFQVRMELFQINSGSLTLLHVSATSLHYTTPLFKLGDSVCFFFISYFQYILFLLVINNHTDHF